MGQKSTLNLETETQTSALRIERLELNLTIEKNSTILFTPVTRTKVRFSKVL